MTKAASALRWLDALRSSRRQPQDDPADVGTAFGLDLSLSLIERPGSAAGAAPATARKGWLQRLRRRGNDAA